MPVGANDTTVEITNTSSTISHRPRASRNRASSAGGRRRAISPALVPARNTKVGAQKCVIQRVANSSGPTAAAVGSCTEPTMTKSRTWSSAISTITSPRSMSIEDMR